MTLTSHLIVSFFASIPVWGWLDVLFTLLVLIGVCGESSWAERLISRNPRDLLPIEFQINKLKRWSERILIIGIAGELLCLPISLLESAEFNKQAAEAQKWASEANERASTNELASKKLDTQLADVKTKLANAETRLLEVKMAALPMDIGDEYSLAEALKPLAGVQVEMRSAPDIKAQQTAELLASTFAMAGWPVINRSFVGDIGEDGIVIGYNGDETSIRAATLLLSLLLERDVPSKILKPRHVRGVPTNTIIVAVMQRPSPLQAELMIVLEKEKQLSDQNPKLLGRIMELASKKFSVGSKELSDAQAEYNNLNLQLSKSEQKEKDLAKRAAELSGEIAREESGTNSLVPGIHIFNTKIPNGLTVTNLFSASSNSTIILRGLHFNSPPLE